MANLDQLFDGSLDEKMDFLEEKKATSNDGLYKVDLSKVKDKKKGYRSVVRFLPNLTQEKKLGQSAIEKISHYVKLPNAKELNGYYDSPKNFGEECPLTTLFYSMQNSKNAVLIEKSKALNYSRKYYSYVLVLEDEQQPELVGKILVMQYGKTIKDKISAEKNGDISGEPCNVFSLTEGKDFVLVVKEISTGDTTYPDYKMSMFKPTTSSMPIYSEKADEFKNIPLTDEGKVSPKAQEKVTDFLLSRDVEVEDFGPKPLTEDQQAKISEITNLLTGKATSNFTSSSGSSEKQPESKDFDFEDNFDEDASEASTVEEEDDFFDDL
jgi:hypothetical protein